MKNGGTASPPSPKFFQNRTLGSDSCGASTYAADSVDAFVGVSSGGGGGEDGSTLTVCITVTGACVTVTVSAAGGGVAAQPAKTRAARTTTARRARMGRSQTETELSITGDQLASCWPPGGAILRRDLGVGDVVGTSRQKSCFPLLLSDFCQTSHGHRSSPARLPLVTLMFRGLVGCQ